MTLSINPIPILSDNYAWLLRDSDSGAMAIVDPADEAPVMAAIEAEAGSGGRLALILLTHHHADHIAAADAVRARTGARIVGAAADQHRLPRLDQAVREGDVVSLGGSRANVIETSGHTRGHISFFFAQTPALFCGDTLFSLGCGRLLEGSAQEMHDSLVRISGLPDDTLICCGHEYTQANARFALAALPHNQALAAQARQIDQQRAEGLPTVPARLGAERSTNPFLLAPSLDEFTRLRSWKDGFR
ncbi:hydroxyacylglutathione hydrolase [Lichenicoccus sp.]|uniref:hydroxyacylglutathione hydrolase n=1 Tax=Lichenicoccus sp. TaxID=2781899 RepID=UPI003D0CB6EE